ncbi:hypothetical protein [Leptolyngbya sp. BL0902]|uniref:hypothetical protein n=1 Tax=Leptolyngbya sp. BL0902 TaxID=1115757 RepID=UPI0018E7DE19|nr:hypothetical protein [Leptolyngbya sp. BL0902]
MKRVSGLPARPALFSNTDRIAILPAATVPRPGCTGECPRLVKPNKDETLVRVTHVVPLASPETAPEEE